MTDPKQPSKDFKHRYDTAKQWRDIIRPSIEEVFMFCAPDRASEFKGISPNHHIEEAETYHSLPEELAMDLAGDLVNYYTPAESIWTEFVVTAPVEEDFADVVEEMVTEREEAIFDLITSSNYNDIAPQWGFEAATHGTPGLWVDQAHLTQPIYFETVPPCELLIVPGHLGYLDRFREQTVYADTLPTILNGLDADLSDPALVQLMKRPGSTATLCWGFWLDWSDPGRPMWKREIVVNGKQVAKPVTIGDMAGSCPLHVGRFDPRPGRPWGRGPGIKTLRDMRTLDKVDEVVMTNLDDALQSTIIYPDDGFIDFSEGIEYGTAYPAHRGFTRDQIYEFPKGGKLDYGFYSEERFEERLRSGFYQDGPRQRGDTPPTATQWVDERRRIQKRLGKPSSPLWTEMIGPIIQRIEFLAMEQGAIESQITVDERVISIQPVSPLMKAQRQDDVLLSRSNLDMAFSVFQDQTASIVDGVATFKKVVRASGDKLTVIRDQEQPVAPPTSEPPE